MNKEISSLFLNPLHDLLFLFQPHPPNCLRSILLHDTPHTTYDHYLSLFTELSKLWNFITPDQFTSHANNSQPLQGRNLLVTFDDGFSSNLPFAKHVLEPLSIKAIFFVVTELIDAPSTYTSKLLKENVFTRAPNPQVNHLRSLSINDIQTLLSLGHTVGSHTKSHRNLAALSLPDLHDQIASPLSYFKTKLGLDIKHFAYPFGDLASFSPEAYSVASDNYSYIHSGLRGDNFHNTTNFFFRDSISHQDSLNVVKLYLNGYLDLLYSSRLKSSQLLTLP